MENSMFENFLYLFLCFNAFMSKIQAQISILKNSDLVFVCLFVFLILFEQKKRLIYETLVI